MEHDIEELELQNIPAAKTMKIGTSLESYLIDHIVMQDQSLLCLRYIKTKEDIIMTKNIKKKKLFSLDNKG